MESDDCSVSYKDEENVICYDDTSYVSQNTLMSRTPSAFISEDGQCSKPGYRSVSELKEMFCDSSPSEKRTDGGARQSGRVVGSRPTSECGSESSGRMCSSLTGKPSEVGSKPTRPSNEDSVGKQDGDESRSDMKQTGLPSLPPSHSSGRVRSRDEEDGSDETNDCLMEDPLIKRKVRVGDLASLLARAQSEAGYPIHCTFHESFLKLKLNTFGICSTIPCMNSNILQFDVAGTRRKLITSTFP